MDEFLAYTIKAGLRSMEVYHIDKKTHKLFMTSKRTPFKKTSKEERKKQFRDFLTENNIPIPAALDKEGK